MNYYGPQRFGTGQSVQSDCVGLALLKEEMVHLGLLCSYITRNFGCQCLYLFCLTCGVGCLSCVSGGSCPSVLHTRRG